MMTLAQTDRPRASLSQRLVKLTNSAAGLDLILRLIQALSQIASEFCTDRETVLRCSIATSQLALGEFSHEMSRLGSRFAPYPDR